MNGQSCSASFYFQLKWALDSFLVHSLGELIEIEHTKKKTFQRRPPPRPPRGAPRPRGPPFK